MEAAPEPRRSERLRRVRDVLLLESDEPATYAEAMVSPDSKAWLEAMRSELKSMDENQVWDLVDPPPGVTAIGCKWVFKKKTDVDGNVQIHKARLVAKGYGQVQGIDYDETYSPVDAEVSEDHTSYSCIFRLRDMADGCQDGFPSRKFNRGRVYDTARGFCRSD